MRDKYLQDASDPTLFSSPGLGGWRLRHLRLGRVPRFRVTSHDPGLTTVRLVEPEFPQHDPREEGDFQPDGRYLSEEIVV